MKIEKAHWVADEDTVRAYFGFSKVDKEKRLVSGFATLDNVDRQKDVVLSDASEKAFGRFRGNIREMHDEKIAAGKMFEFKPSEFFDKESGKTYKGVYVTAYVSKGAPLTWEKVLDGTLSGFSIGGKINDSSNEFSKDHGGTVRIIKDFDLFELSLVDNPANQFANIDSLVKIFDGEMTGSIADTLIKNVVWCATDEVARATTEDEENCLFCKNAMSNIGWFEAGDEDDEKVKEVVNKFLSPELENGEGGVEMTAKKEDEKAEVVTEEVAPVEEPEETVETVVLPGEPLDPGEDQPDLKKMLADLHETLKTSFEETTAEAIGKFEEQVNDISKSFGDKFTEYETKLSELASKVADLKGVNDDVAKRLDSLESETAIKKSGDLESPVVLKSTSKADVWNGAFVGVEDLVG